MLRALRMRSVGRRHRGQTLAEFAIVFPILMLVFGAIIQFGLIFWGQNSLNQAVRDAGRYAVTAPNCEGPSHDDVVDKTKEIARSMGVARVEGIPVVTMPTNGETVEGTSDPVSDKAGISQPNLCPPATNKDHVWVRITVDAKVPIFFPFVPGDGHISSTALFRMEPAP